MNVWLQTPLFDATDELTRDYGSTNISFEDIGRPFDTSIEDFLLSELDTPVLNELYPYLWFFAKKSSAHIDAIHQHIMKQRNVIVTEDPALHLVWFYGTIFLKPIPKFLMSHTFWKDHLMPPNVPQEGRFQVDDLSHVCRTAVGFLKSYSHLVRHGSDFIIAQQSNLIPKDIEFIDFQRFIRCFRMIEDQAVSPRYHFGQFRLTRLNWAICLLPPHGRWTLVFRRYHREHMQTGQYIQRYAGLLLFIFAVLTLILSAMQVVATVLGDQTWDAFVRASWGFSVAVIISILVLCIWTMTGVVGFLLSQAHFALKMRFAKKSNADHA